MTDGATNLAANWTTKSTDSFMAEENYIELGRALSQQRDFQVVEYKVIDAHCSLQWNLQESH